MSQRKHFGTTVGSSLTISEEVQACCIIARERLEAGDYDGARSALQRWWTIGESPCHDSLTDIAAAELLLTVGTLTGSLSSAKQIQDGQKTAEALLSGSITLFDRLGQRDRACEGRIELACCYWRQGLFDLARRLLRSTLQELSIDSVELRSVALVRLALVERHAGRLQDALSLFHEAAPLMATCTPWTEGRFHQEFATALKNIGLAEGKHAYLNLALQHYEEALSLFEKIGNRRYVAVVANNHGYLLLSLKRFDEGQLHLERARELFDGFGDSVRRAQVDETLAQLYLASDRSELAERAINRAVETLETSGEEALLAEALTTQGLVLCKLGRRHEAKPILQRAHRVAERCGDNEGAGKALLILIEEMCAQLGDDELREIGARADQLLANSQQKSTRDRLRLCMERIAAAHAEFEQQREKAAHAEKMAALGELSFGVAHNVNNSLTGILGRAQLLLRSRDVEKISAGLELIIKSAEDGAHIIRRIQDFARQQPSREFEPVSVAQLLKDVSEMSRPRWETRAATASVRLSLFADCTASAMGDAVELREVLVNMIYNAIDAMPQGGEIRLSAQEAEGRVKITVADSGTGMTPEVKSRLFDPFFTTKGRNGTGMGLAVSFGIIRRHNGSIDVESEAGKGTTFIISLPLARAAAPSFTPTPSKSDSQPLESKLRVLVVDDEKIVRELLREALEAEGCEVIVTDSGQAALQAFDSSKDQIEAVFTDIGMPDMSGWELAKEIRKRSDTVALAIVSGWGDAIGCDAQKSVKADWVVAKPFDIDRIAEIAAALATRKAVRARSPISD